MPIKTTISQVTASLKAKDPSNNDVDLNVDVSGNLLTASSGGGSTTELMRHLFDNGIFKSFQGNAGILYTVPAGKKFVVTAMNVTNSGGGNLYIYNSSATAIFTITSGGSDSHTTTSGAFGFNHYVMIEGDYAQVISGTGSICGYEINA